MTSEKQYRVSKNNRIAMPPGLVGKYYLRRVCADGAITFLPVKVPKARKKKMVMEPEPEPEATDELEWMRWRPEIEDTTPKQAEELYKEKQASEPQTKSG